MDNFLDLLNMFDNISIGDVSLSNETETGLVCRSTYCQSLINPGRTVMGPGFADNGASYTGRSGTTFNTNKPPPQSCFICGEAHWRKVCPFGRR